MNTVAETVSRSLPAGGSGSSGGGPEAPVRTLIAANSCTVEQICRETADLAGEWHCFGNSYARLKSLELALPGPLVRFDAAQELEHAAAALRESYSEWIDALGVGQDLAWLFGGTATRSPYLSGIFDHICSLEVVRRRLAVGRVPALVVTESAALAAALAALLAESGHAVQMLDAEPRPGGFALAKILWGIWRRTAGVFRHRVRAYRKHKRELAAPPIDVPVVLVDTFLHKDSFARGPVFRDRYHPGLQEFFARRGLRVLIHFTPFEIADYDRLYGEMAASGALFLCPERFLKTGDYLAALLQPWWHFRHRRRMPARFGALDVRRLWDEEFRRTAETGILPMLIYRLMLRLGQAGVRVAHVIDWHENQPIDKALAAGIHKAHPGVRVAGAQMFFHSPNCPGLFPTLREVRAGLSPDVLLAPGQAQLRLAEVHAPFLPRRLAPSLRHAHVFDQPAPGTVGGGQPRTVLVLLPNMLGDAVELVDKILGILDAIPQDIRVVCKSHPDCSPEEFMRLFGQSAWSARIELQSGRLEAFMDGAQAAIASGTSSVIEVAAWGVPVLMWSRAAALSMDIDVGIETPLLARCFDAQQAREFLRQNLGAQDREALRREGLRLRDLCFTPALPGSMVAYLPGGAED